MSESTSKYQLSSEITAHAWNADRTMLAICPNTSEVWIYTGCGDPDASKWVKQWVLSEHDLIVSGIDWSPVSNKIVTCSHDRNSFVWTLQPDNQWKPELVILRINRAATAVKWTPDGQKFAVASGAKCVPVCHYEQANDWWISKMIKKHKSTIVDIDWHPSSQIVATACADFKCRVFSAFVDGLDVDMNNPVFKPRPFGDLIFESDTAQGWVEYVAWSPSGYILAYAAHNSSVSVVTFLQDQPPYQQHISLTQLPVVCGSFLADDTLVVAGHDMNPMLFTSDTNQMWQFNQYLDKKKEQKKETRQSNFGAARALFESKVSRGTTGGASKDSAKLWTQHENVITTLVNMGNGFISTSGLDGKLIIWNLEKCC